MKEVKFGLYSDKRNLYTVSSAPGIRIYGEKLVRKKGKELRMWNPYRSKLAAALKKNLKTWPLKKNSNILYLGAATGTTLSHLADICTDGALFGVDISSKTTQKLLTVCQNRENIYPILDDASRPDRYAKYFEEIEIDLLYQDISQKNQSEIFIKNAALFLKSGKNAFFIVKAKSISSTKSTEEMFADEEKEISKHFKVINKFPLFPYDKHHMFYVLERV